MSGFRRAVRDYLAGRDYDTIALADGMYRLMKGLTLHAVAAAVIALLILDPPLGLTYLGLIVLVALPALVRRVNQWRRR